MNIRRPLTAAACAAGCVVASTLTAATAHAGAGFVKPRGGYYSSNNYRSLCAPPADTVAPSVSAITFGRPTINLNSGSRTQTVRATAADTSGKGDPSGVRSLRLDIQGAGFYAPVTLRRTSGTDASGGWTGQFAISKYARPGTYSIGEVMVNDHAGNVQFYSGYGTPDSPNALALHPADNPRFTVTGTPATRPTPKPAGRLGSFSFSPRTVNTTSAPKFVHVTAHFTGAVPQRVYVNFYSDKRFIGGYADLYTRMLHHPGGWSAAVRIPRWLGKQTVQPYLQAVWGSGYRPSARFWSADDLAARHFPTRLSVISGVDTTKPVLTSVSFSPRSVDSTAGRVTLTVTANAKDVSSGVRSISVGGYIQHGENGVASGAYPMASAGIGYFASNDFWVQLHKNSAGHWVGTTVIRQCVPSGTYKLSAELQDVAGNFRSYSTKQLAAAHLTSTIDIKSKHGDVAAPYVYSAATYTANKQLFLNFSEGVSNVTTSTLAVYPLAPARTRFTKPADVTAITCSNGTTTVDCSGANGLVTSAELTVPSLTPGATYQVYSNLNQVVPQLVDGNRNPMDWEWAQAQVKGS